MADGDRWGLHHVAARAASRSHRGRWATAPITESALFRLLFTSTS